MSRLLPIATVVLALSLGSWLRRDALDAGFWADDYLHHAMLAGHYPAARAPYDLFGFARGGDDTAALIAFGYYPWWSHPEFRLNMLRPGASLLHALDHQLGLDARAQHWHSLLWWAIAVIAVAALLFEALPRSAAACAVVLFALDESHSVPLVWLSNRSSLIATALGAAAVWLHVRWRRTQSLAARLGSLALLALALFAGEYALAMFGYLICFELVTKPTGASRVRALAPAFVLALSFAGAWVALGYGSAHSSLYTNPLHEPAAFAHKLAVGLPVLLGELVLGVRADDYVFGFGAVGPLGALALWWRSVMIGLGVVSGAVAIALLRFLSRRIAPDHARALYWLGGGALLGLLPVLGSFITTRLVLQASIGFAALFGSALALVGAALRDVRTRGVPGPLATAAALLLVYVQVYRPAVASRETVDYYRRLAIARTFWPLTAEVDNARIASQQVVMISAPDVNDAPYLPFIWLEYGRPLPRGFRLLSAYPGALRLLRIDDRSLELLALSKDDLAGIAGGSLTRSPDELWQRGDRFAVPGMRIDIVETYAGQPLRVRYIFDSSLDDPRWLWLASTADGVHRVSIPPPGKVVRIEPPTLPDASRLVARRR